MSDRVIVRDNDASYSGTSHNVVPLANPPPPDPRCGVLPPPLRCDAEGNVIYSVVSNSGTVVVPPPKPPEPFHMLEFGVCVFFCCAGTALILLASAVLLKISSKAARDDFRTWNQRERRP